MEVERECKLRKMLERVYFRKETEFADIFDYNNYLEDFENIIFDLKEMDESGINIAIDGIKKKWGEISRKNHGIDINVEDREIKKVALTKNVVEEDEAFDPLDGIEIPKNYITQKHKIPEVYKINNVVGGFSENLIIFKAIHSLYDDKI